MQADGWIGSQPAADAGAATMSATKAAASRRMPAKTNAAPETCSVERVAQDRARHAARAAATGAELAAGDRDDLDPRVAQARIRLAVALIGDDGARPERERVVAVVPLLPLRGDRIEAGVDHAQPPDPHRARSRV